MFFFLLILQLYSHYFRYFFILSVTLRHHRTFQTKTKNFFWKKTKNECFFVYILYRILEVWCHCCFLLWLNPKIWCCLHRSSLFRSDIRKMENWRPQPGLDVFLFFVVMHIIFETLSCSLHRWRAAVTCTCRLFPFMMCTLMLTGASMLLP